MAKSGIVFGDKTWKAFTKNAEKAVKEFGTILDKEMLERAHELKRNLEAAYDEAIDIDQDFTIDDKQADIFNLHRAKYAKSGVSGGDRSHDEADSSSFNTLRGANTNIICYITFNKRDHTFKVGAAGNDLLYIEYGSGDLGKDYSDKEARAAAKGINLKDYNSGPTIHESNIPGLEGYKYWVYHSSVHFGIPTLEGAPGYRTFKDFKEDIGKRLTSTGASRYTVSAQLQALYTGKRS